MTSEVNASSGSAPTPGGISADSEVKKDTVAYETYRKVLSEKKAKDEQLEEAKAKLSAIEKEKKEREETELKAKENFKALVELRDKELETERSKNANLIKERQTALKLDSFLQTLDGKVEPKYWGMIDLEEIKENPADGKIDQMSVAQAVENFRKNYPELIKTGAGAKTSAEAPTGHDNLTYEDWLKLPSKEMAKRAKDIINKI